MEMISSITPKIRNHVIYATSLYVKQYVPKTPFVKTGIMLDLGETDESVCGK
jgi:lipoate synthase